MSLICFDEVFEKEIREAVRARRERYRNQRQAPDKAREGKRSAKWRVGEPPPYDPEPQTEPALELEGADVDGHPIKCPTEGTELIGLALSGGGIRSAAFCLGALQALDEEKVLGRVDYLSTVSGGGYIGTSMTAAMSASGKADFPFPSKLEPEENPSIRHVRDHSNYLFPRGLSDLLGNMGIYLRGLMANAILLLPWLTLAALITIALVPSPIAAVPRHWKSVYSPQHHPHWTVPALFELNQFALTASVAVLFAGLLVAWGLHRSVLGPGKADVDSLGMRLARWGLIVLCIVAWCELQPIILGGMLDIGRPKTQGIIGPFLTGLLSAAPKILAAFGALVGIFSTVFADVLKRDRVVSSTRRGRVVPLLAAAAVYIAAAAVPLLLWIAYFYLSIWGICTPELHGCPAGTTPAWLSDFADAIPAAGIFHSIKQNTPDWLGTLYATRIDQLYALVFIFFVVLQFLLLPNSNSLHRLYRDRLSKAFLFRPGEFVEHERDSLRQWPHSWIAKRLPAAVRNLLYSIAVRISELAGRVGRRSGHGKGPGLDVVKTLKPFDDKFSAIADDCGPYQIINAALNIGGSKYANQRGRNADFFVFTSKYIGSRATHYVPTKSVEERVPDLDLAAAMAISGAAASSNMGSNTIKALAPTLAILNIRLGFWLLNPRVIADARYKSVIARLDRLYFLKEMLGWLSEDDDLIYLTDGGHIENLGIYELLRRRCALIIAVDAEADPGMNFNSLIALQRHALIDLGVRIELPWSTIRDATCAAGDEVTETGGVAWSHAKHGPHVALGKID